MSALTEIARGKQAQQFATPGQPFAQPAPQPAPVNPMVAHQQMQAIQQALATGQPMPEQPIGPEALQGAPGVKRPGGAVEESPGLLRKRKRTAKLSKYEKLLMQADEAGLDVSAIDTLLGGELPKSQSPMKQAATDQFSDEDLESMSEEDFQTLLAEMDQ
jgi:hypothetical protein